MTPTTPRRRRRHRADADDTAHDGTTPCKAGEIQTVTGPVIWLLRCSCTRHAVSHGGGGAMNSKRVEIQYRRHGASGRHAPQAPQQDTQLRHAKNVNKVGWRCRTAHRTLRARTTKHGPSGLTTSDLATRQLAGSTATSRTAPRHRHGSAHALNLFKNSCSGTPLLSPRLPIPITHAHNSVRTPRNMQ